jgi:hypothetical protein
MGILSKAGAIAATAAILAIAAHQALAQPGPAPAPAAPAAGRGGGRGGAANPDPAAQLSMPVATSFTSKIGYFTAERDPGASYPRVIQLKSGAARGTLLATYGHRGGLPIWRSTDNGETWTHLSDVPQIGGQPCLYEVPSQMGEFPAGTVMACGTGAGIAPPGATSLDVAVSRDGGRTWTHLSTIATGRPAPYNPASRSGLSRDNAPIWEPFLGADSRGRLVAYFSDERDKKNAFNQLLDHVVSEDGGRTWGPLVYDVAIPDGLSRPGMPIIARDGAGKFYMSYELVSAPGFALEPRTNSMHFKTSMDGLNWGDPKDPGTLIQDRWRQFPNGTPYIVWSPWGGPRGTLVAASRSVVRDNLGRVGGGMFVNRNGGEGLWTLIETPIWYQIDNDGYSQSMIPLGDGQEILQLVSVNDRIYHVKFKLPEKLPTYGFPWDSGPDTGPR